MNNHASYFGGVYLNGLSISPYSYAYNCLIYFNTAGTNANFGPTNLFADHCCTFPMPTGGVGNISNNPALVDAFGGDFHLQAGSPCINSGGNAIMTNWRLGRWRHAADALWKPDARSCLARFGCQLAGWFDTD
jgi:hypothetical protein